MKAIKGNKVYTINEIDKKDYLSQGYDITDDNGIVTDHSPTAAVPYADYAKLAAENEALKNQLASKRK